MVDMRNKEKVVMDSLAGNSFNLSPKTNPFNS